MGERVAFVLSAVIVLILHLLLLRQPVQVKVQSVISPQEKVSQFIQLQRVSLKKPTPRQTEQPVPHKPELKPVVRQKPKPKKVKKPLRKSRKKKPQKRVVQQKPPQKKEERISSETVQPRTSPVTKIVQQNYLQKVREKIERYKKYPRSAKRLRQEGEVVVSFTISKNGEISDVRLLRPSRYKKLNRATLSIFKAIGRFDPIPHTLHKKSWSITVPVAYKIIET